MYHCGGQEHLVERCFKLIDYPKKRDFSKSKSNKFANNVEGVECTKADNDKFGINSTVLTPDVIKQLLRLVNSQKLEGPFKVKGFIWLQTNSLLLCEDLRFLSNHRSSCVTSYFLL